MADKIRVVFISNFMNHHQIEFCDSMANDERIIFRFIETEHLPLEKEKVGYSNYSNRDYILKYYDSRDEKHATDFIKEADFVICPPTCNFFNICKKDAFFFIISEHIFKSNFSCSIKNIYRFFKYKILSSKIKKLNRRTFILCSSYKTKSDYFKCGFDWVDGFIRWGYFPKLKVVDASKKWLSCINEYKLLWVNRMLKWKHPEKAVDILHLFNKKGLKAKLCFVGDGEAKKRAIKRVRHLKLENQVSFLGFIPNDLVLEKMKDSHFILSTSDRGEGWGATINEGMSLECVPIANKQIGCSGYLINNNNGIKYKKISDIKIPDLDKLRLMSRNANETILNCWNGVSASNALIELIVSLDAHNTLETSDSVLPGTLIGD